MIAASMVTKAHVLNMMGQHITAKIMLASLPDIKCDTESSIPCF